VHYHQYEHFYLWQGISLSVTDGLQMAQAKPGLQSAAAVTHIPLAGCGLRRISCFATWLQCRGLHYLCQCQLPSLQWLMTGWRYGGWRQPRVASAVGMSYYVIYSSQFVMASFVYGRFVLFRTAFPSTLYVVP